MFTIRHSVVGCFTPVADVGSLTAREETTKQQISLNNLTNPELSQRFPRDLLLPCRIARVALALCWDSGLPQHFTLRIMHPHTGPGPAQTGPGFDIMYGALRSEEVLRTFRQARSVTSQGRLLEPGCFPEMYIGSDRYRL